MPLQGQAGPAASASPELVSLPSDRQSLSVTVYNDDVALVKDARRLDLAAGENRVALREVAARIRPETASLRSLGGGGFTVLEQNFDFDLLTPAALLQKYSGREVQVIRTNPASGAETRETATVLSTQNGVVLRYRDRIESGVAGRLAFPDVPADLRDRPTLSVTLDAGAAGVQPVELMYLTAGLGWRADYAATLSGDGRQMSLTGWVTLTNTSGTRYDNARLQLVAGTVNRVAPPGPMMPLAKSMALAAAAPQPAEEKLFEYHLYTLDRSATLLDNQIKQVALLSAPAIPVSRERVLEGSANIYLGRYEQVQRQLHPDVYLSFANRGADLGRPLPKGTVRVYTRDSQGGAQFIGEDAIGHTAAGEIVRLKLGEAFDLTADRTQTEAHRAGERSWQSSYRIELRNADPAAASVIVREPMPGDDWTVLKENQPHQRESARIARWPVEVPGKGTAVLEYTVQNRW